MPSPSLEDRVGQLEREMRGLRAAIERIPTTTQPTDGTVNVTPSSEPVIAESTPEASAPLEVSSHESPAQPATTNQPTLAPSKSKWTFEHGSEWWLNKVGIGLLLLGLAFLFKYSIDQGWLTPAIRVVFGVVLGGLLAGLGLKIRTKREHFAQVLLGGAIATWYITLFAAFNFYALLSFPVAGGLMILVTILGFVAAHYYKAPVLAAIASIGGFATPFLLHSADTNLTTLMTYSSIMTLAATGLYFVHGWRLQLWIAGLGATVLTSLSLTIYFDGQAHLVSDQILIQTHVMVLWLAFTVLPLLRIMLSAKGLKRWTTPMINWLGAESNKTLNAHGIIFIIATAIALASFTIAIWSNDLTKEQGGVIFLAVGILYMSIAAIAQWKKLAHSYVRTNYVISLLALIISLLMILEGDSLLIALSLVSLLLFWLGSRHNSFTTQVVAICIQGPMVMWLFNFLQVSQSDSLMPFVNMRSLAIAVAITTLLTSGYLIQSKINQVQIVVGHVFVLLWMSSQLNILGDTGSVLVTVAWGVQALATLIFGLVKQSGLYRWLGTAFLVLVLGKLFLVDLVQLEMIWRVILFMGFGGLFLFVSYFVQRLSHGNKS